MIFAEKAKWQETQLAIAIEKQTENIMQTCKKQQSLSTEKKQKLQLAQNASKQQKKQTKNSQPAVFSTKKDGNGCLF